MTLRRSLFVLLVAAAVIVAALAIFVVARDRSVVSATVDTELTPQQIKTLAPKGRYLAAAADCTACHTAPGGAPFAGGLPFAMPFGTIYATNITPDPETGIGDWSRADFHHALRDGVGKGGRHLYPAMPYVSYRKLSEADVDAIHAFLKTQPPMRVANKTNSFPFVLGRPFMILWNAINLPAQAFQEDSARSAEWNRGHYLVDALGHCGECHTPRNITMAMIASRYLQGAPVEKVMAPNITPEALAKLGFDKESLAEYMRTGIGPQGVMSFSMYSVVSHSTRYLTEADAQAMARYLTADAASATAAAPQSSKAAEVAQAGQPLYSDLCAGCHGFDGQGVPHVAPALSSNATLRLPDSRNLLVVLLKGLPGGPYPDGERMQPMPGFDNLLSDQQTADLANYLRTRWGGGGSHPVEAEQVSKVRAEQAGS